MDSFKTIKEQTMAEITEKKSRFIANIFHIETKEEAENIIKQINKRYFDARHNCYAYIIIENNKKFEKCSDDGEPSGTAGAPMLTVLNKNNLSNILVIVTRYFGGVLLGTGGLVRAYSQAMSEALQKATLLEKQLGDKLRILIEYKEMEKFKYYCKMQNIRITKEQYADKVEIEVEMTRQKSKDLQTKLDNFNFKILKIDKILEKYVTVDI